jgi:putative FmdB family regulatory protein
MPIYEYQCGACQTRLEKLQKLSDPPLLTCPECGADALVKLVSAAGFRLKGGGWYETDFKKDGKRNLAGDDKPAADKKPEGESKKAGVDAGSTAPAAKAPDKPAAAKSSPSPHY